MAGDAPRLTIFIAGGYGTFGGRLATLQTAKTGSSTARNGRRAGSSRPGNGKKTGSSTARNGKKTGKTMLTTGQRNIIAGAIMVGGITAVPPTRLGESQPGW